MPKIDVAGLKVDALTKNQFLLEVERRLSVNQQTFVITPYSEFLYGALRDREVMNLLNSADLSIPDGIGVIWAERFLSLSFSFNNFYLKIVQALWQIKYSLAAILFYPKWIYRNFPEKLVGADVVWDIAKLAHDKNLSIYFLGARGKNAELAANALLKKFPNLKIAGVSTKDFTDPSILNDIKIAKPDILFVAFSPPNQEKWIAQNIKNLRIKLAIGLGGTFDYLAQSRKAPPTFIRKIGLEWLYRLITQPHRIWRIKNATWDLIVAMLRYKVFTSMPLRQNVVSVILNKNNEVFVGKRNSEDSRKYFINESSLDNYWQFPQGGMEKGETIEQTSLREIREEIGTNKVKTIGISKFDRTYIWDNGFRPLLRNPYKNKGQHQHIVYLKYFGDGSDIKFNSEEFVGYKWVKIDEILNVVHVQRRPVVDIVLKDLPGIIEESA